MLFLFIYFDRTRFFEILRAPCTWLFLNRVTGVRSSRFGIVAFSSGLAFEALVVGDPFLQLEFEGLGSVHPLVLPRIDEAP